MAMFSLEQRKRALEQMREEAEADLKRLGCTCAPTFTLTERTFGRYDLPAWESDHTDDCALVKATGLKGDSKAVMVGSSIAERLKRLKDAE